MTNKEEWSIAGNSVRNYGYEVSSVDGWDGFSGRRGDNTAIASMHGTRHVTRKPYQAKRFRLPVLIRPYNPTTGAVDHAEGAHGHIRQNLDALMGWLDSRDGTISVTRDVPDPSGGTETREAICEPRDPVYVTDDAGIMRAVVLDFVIPSGFWRITPQRSVLAFTSNSPTIGGNAPVNDMVVRLVGGTGAVFTDNTNGDTFTVDGATPSGGIDIDVGTREITKVTGGAYYDANVEPSSDWWMEWRPGAVSLSVSGGGTASIYWYDKTQ